MYSIENTNKASKVSGFIIFRETKNAGPDALLNSFPVIYFSLRTLTGREKGSSGGVLSAAQIKHFIIS